MRLVDGQLGDSSPHYLFLFFSSHHIPAHCSLICLSTTETALLEAKCFLIVNSFSTCSSSIFEHLLMQKTMLGKGYILLNNDDDNDSNYDNTYVN